MYEIKSSGTYWIIIIIAIIIVIVSIILIIIMSIIIIITIIIIVVSIIIIIIISIYCLGECNYLQMTLRELLVSTEYNPHIINIYILWKIQNPIFNSLRFSKPIYNMQWNFETLFYEATIFIITIITIITMILHHHLYHFHYH